MDSNLWIVHQKERLKLWVNRLIEQGFEIQNKAQ